MEKYQLLNGNTLVASFTHERTLLGDVYSNIKVHEPDQLPIRLRNSCDSGHLMDWINRRSVPVNRHHMEAMLGALNLKEPFDLMRYSHALSLNDTFWIKEESENLSFDAINLYDNKFDEALGWIAFTGLPSDISRNLSTPELTTVGMLPKYWQRIGFEDIILCKGGTSGYSNAGYEPYNEVAAHIVAKHLGIPTIPYHLEKRNDKIVSISKLFTTKQIGLMTGSEYLDHKYPDRRYKNLNDLFQSMKADGIDLRGFYEMCFLDYIIENFDRHLNNWGLSVDNQSQRILGISPIWDNGMSLDYDKPKDMRDRFDFASFNIKYDFIKDCEYTRNFESRVNKLLAAIKSGELLNKICVDTEKFYPDSDIHKKTVEFVEARCMEFLKPLDRSMLKPGILHDVPVSPVSSDVLAKPTSSDAPKSSVMDEIAADKQKKLQTAGAAEDSPAMSARKKKKDLEL